MELVKATTELKETIADRAKKLHTLKPSDWVVIVSKDANKIVMTLRSYMNRGFLKKYRLHSKTTKEGKVLVKFS